MAGSYDWNVNTPPAQQTRRLGDDELRKIKSELQRAFVDGPMSLFPGSSHCTPGWPVPFLYNTLAELQVNTAVAPFGRIGILVADGSNNGLWVELSTGWMKVNGT